MNTIQNFTHKIRKLGLLIALVAMVFQNPTITYAESVYEELPMFGTEKTFSDTCANTARVGVSCGGDITVKSKIQDFSTAEHIRFTYYIYAYNGGYGAYSSSTMTTVSAYFTDISGNRIGDYPNGSTYIDYVSASDGSTAQRTKTVDIPLDAFMLANDCSNAIFVINIHGNGYVNGSAQGSSAKTEASLSDIQILKSPQSPYFSGFEARSDLTVVILRKNHCKTSLSQCNYCRIIQISPPFTMPFPNLSSAIQSCLVRPRNPYSIFSFQCAIYKHTKTCLYRL